MTMIAVLDKTPGNAADHAAFLKALRQQGFEGEIGTTHDTRLVHATDNSIYQRHPEAVVFPRHRQDLIVLARLAGEPVWRGITIAPRGGGTGTNGQSLTDGIVVDLSRHMNAILEINVEEKWVRVQPGVVKDQLNAAIARHGLFFAPELSTSNRATIGGMISTDASGQGSCTYGKTRDHVLGVTAVLVGGDVLDTSPLDESELAVRRQGRSRVAQIHDCVAAIHDRERDTIEEVFPKLNRCLTGYDLRHLRNEAGQFDLTSLLCGSEGTLGFLAEAKLNLLAIPPHSILVNIRYDSFMDALRDARALIGLKPLSIETIDSKVLGLAMQDFVWSSVESYFPQDEAGPAKGLNLVEFAGHDEAELERQVEGFLEHLRQDQTVRRRGHTLARGRQAVSQVYAMRKRAVGLLGNVQGEARPQPFVEDTAVPPEKLADFIAEFRALLDGHGLDYGMFGHVDAGVLHVRPLLDMRNPDDAALIRPLSDAVHRLTRRYGGLLWGEHGKGVRSEYVPDVFGPLYPCLEQIKGVFDPHNQLNPGKIAAPPGASAPLLRVDDVPMRGAQDRQIPDPVWKGYGAALHCNGNGACFNYDQDDPMCPSWKATRDRRFSPKGRASLMREWLRLQAGAGVDTAALEAHTPSLLSRVSAQFRRRQNTPVDFSHQLYDSLATCLACKSCTSQCPVKVDVPDFRSRFLNLYHQRYARPLRDYVVGLIEYTLPLMARMRRLYNAVVSLKPMAALGKTLLGLVDMPPLSRSALAETCRRWHVQPATPERLVALTEAERARSVILMPDLFTRHFEAHLVEAFIELAARCSYRVYLAESLACGKPLHVHGFLGLFARQARRNAAWLRILASFGVPIVGLDPAMTLIYRQEYRKIAGLEALPEVQLPQEFLLRALPRIQDAPQAAAGFVFLGHCTEKTALTGSGADWQALFARLGLGLQLEKTGCCGMSGTFGHEARNVETSRVIFEQSWGPHLDRQGEKIVLASGYSCRSQVKRFRGARLDHPLVALLDRLRDIAPESARPV